MQHILAIGFHVKLLQMRSEANQHLRVGQNSTCLVTQEIAVPDLRVERVCVGENARARARKRQQESVCAEWGT